MASQSLYRKWRSQTFGEVVGQEEIVRTLKNALATQTLAHAYLFTGPRGTGKTTTARLLAKTINCLNLQNGEPCNECSQCREITAGSSFNVIEIDAASNRGIDSIRELREKVMMPPATGRYKVYILDEAHMLTTEAFNALLKTLEEPPPHAIFVMATTDVHKMLPTVLSRCQRFDFKRFNIRQIVQHLGFIAEQEQIQLETGAAELIARAAAGGMRDALSLLDQAIAYSGQQITLAQVQTMLGVADPRAIQKIIAQVANLDSSAGLHLINELAEAGADLRQLNIQIAEYWRAMMLNRAGADIAGILDNTEDEIREITQTAQLFALETLIECARVFAQNDLMQKNQGTPQLGLELAFLACIELHRHGAQTASQRSIQPPANASMPARAVPAQEPARRPAPFTPPAAISAPTRVETPPASLTPPGPSSNTNQEPPSEMPDWDDVSYQDEEEVFEPLKAAPPPAVTSAPLIENTPTAPAEETSSQAPLLTIQDVKERWEYIKKRVKTKKDGGKIVAFLNGYVILGIEGSSERPIILLRANADFHYKALHLKTEYHEIIVWAIKVELHQECEVRLLPPSYGEGLIGATLPPPATPPSSGRTANTTGARPQQPSAHREKSASAPPPISARATMPEPVSQPAPPKPELQAPSTNHSEPLARMPIVRENSSVSSSPIEEISKPVVNEFRLAQLKRQSSNNQVVQRITEMFKAEIKEVRPK